MRIRKILVPTDFSDSAVAAAQYAINLAAELGARVVLLHSYFIPVFPTGPDGAGVIPTPAAVTNLMGSSDAELARFRASLGHDGLVADARTVEGSPAEVITRVARDEGFDLIVMGTHGRSGLKHLLMGSVAERVVRTADTPVLTLRTPARRVRHEMMPNGHVPVPA